MATGTIVEAIRTGTSVRISADVDEGLAGHVVYTAEVLIAELKMLDTPLKRRNALVAALKARRDAVLEDDAVEGHIGTLYGAEVTL